MDTAVSALVRQVGVKRIAGGEETRTTDSVAVEEPLEIRVQHWFKGVQRAENLALMMRTPGHDYELAAGFLLSEAIVQNPRDIVQIRTLGGDGSNELLVELSTEVDMEAWRTSRSTFVSSSCGICGKRSAQALQEALPSLSAQNGFQIDAARINRLPALLAAHQKAFAATGGLHAAALVQSDGSISQVFEDIGRHNALDKLIGSQFLSGHTPLAGRILFLSSRSSFELVQKAAAAGAPVLATVGSPSSLAIESARACGLTLLGFVRQDRFNIYSGDWRINL